MRVVLFASSSVAHKALSLGGRNGFHHVLVSQPLAQRVPLQASAACRNNVEGSHS